MKNLMSVRAFVLIAFVATTGPALAAELEALRSGEPANYTVPIRPGQLFTFNFIAGPLGSKVAASFESRGAPLVVSAIVHPRTDLTQNGEELVVECPGIGNHPLQISSTISGQQDGVIHVNPTEAGVFGFTFRNTTHALSTLRVSIVTEQTISIGFVGLREGDVVPVPSNLPDPGKT